MSNRRPGKTVAGRLYVHRSALHLLGRDIQDKIKFAQESVPDWSNWAIARVSLTSNQVALIESPDWDTADEPSVGAMMVVDGCDLKFRPDTGTMIYHHKWMFVADDYDGFDVEDSKARSASWESLDPPVDKKRIGRREYWESHVVTRLGAEVKD